MFQNSLVRSFFLCLIATAAGSTCFAQVTQTGIHGTVKDSSGAVVPAAVLQLTDIATNTARKTTAGDNGSFVFTGLQDGDYRLVASKPGFANAVTDSITVDAGRITDVNIVLQVGGTTDTVEVTASAVALETTSNEIGTTISTKEVNTLPFDQRDALYFALLTPGVQSSSAGATVAGQNGGAESRYSTFNGLPNASLDITLDGMNNNSQRFKSGGTSFYAFAPERLDAVDEMTVSTSGLGADAAGQGAMQIRFTTKRGTDQYHFHVLQQFGNEDLNANTWFNNVEGIRRPKTRPLNYAGNLGGPLVPFIPSMRHRMFFFLNFEDQPQPSSAVIGNTILTPDAFNGNFTYLGTDGLNHTVNVLTVAAQNGYASTLNSTTQSEINAIRATQNNPAVIGYLPIANTPYEQTMNWNTPLNLDNKYPTARFDFQINPSVAYHTTWNLRHTVYTGHPEWPGAPIPDLYPGAESYKITTYVWTHAVDWTINPHLTDTFNFGIQSNHEYFYDPANPHMFDAYGGNYISFSNGSTSLISPYISNALPTDRNNPVYQATNQVTWVKNKHTFLFGGSLLYTNFYEYDYNSAGIPQISTGVSSLNPFGTILQNAMPFVNLNGSDVANAKALYGMLTGTIMSYSTSNNVNENTHQYAQYAPEIQRIAHTTAGLYAQDNWRVLPNLTVTLGFRWEFDGAIHATNGIDSEANSLFGPSTVQFAPGLLNGNSNPTYSIVNNPYNGDFKNPAPSAGLSWSPHADSGPLAKLLGHDRTVIGVSYRITRYDEGLNAISNLTGSNPGPTQSISGSAALAANPTNYFVGVNTPPTVNVPASFNFPLPLSNYVLNGGQSSYYVNPYLLTPYVQDWNIRIQRELARGNVLSVSYIGNKGTHLWHYQNVQEVNIFENGFLKEFQNAQSNLAIANGMSVAQLTSLPLATLKTTNFSNQGLPGQVPLPIFQTAFGPNGSNAALSSSLGFANSTFITDLEEGAAGALANSLAATSTSNYACRLFGSALGPCAAQGFSQATGYPINFFVANPYANAVNYENDDANTNYNGLQIHYQHAPIHGLTLDASYTWSHTLGTLQNAQGQSGNTTWYTMRNGRLSYGPTPFDQRQVLILYGLYQLPFGKGKLVGINNRVLNGIFGNWTLGSTNTIASGNPVAFSGGRQVYNANSSADGVVFGNSLTLQQLVQRTETQTTGFVKSCNCIDTNVSGISLANGAPNPAYLAPAQQAGVFASPLYYTGKTTFALNMSLQKEFAIRERWRLGFYADATNWLNHPFFSQGNISTTATTFGQITSAAGTRSVLLRGYLNF